ncbi:MAG: hypothetical protein ACKOXI_04965 [Candidatus Planktophila sp.]
MFWKIIEAGLYVTAVVGIFTATTPAALVTATLVAGFGSMTYGRALRD